MAEDSFQERTEKATPRRRDKAREEGRVAKSMELNAAAVIMLGFTSLFLLGPFIAERTLDLMRYTLSHAPDLAQSQPTFHKFFVDNLVRFFTIVSPVFITMLVIGLIVNIAQVGFKVSTKAIEPKFEKLNVVEGVKKLFSMRSLVQLCRDTIKLVVVGFVAYKVIRSEFDGFFALADMTTIEFAVTMGKLAMMVALKIGVVIAIIAVLDYAYQKYEFEKSIKMSKQEIKDEYKDTDGNPQLKQRVRQIQRETSRRRMMDAVPTADVVVTNPTHLAVALKYDPSEMGAPVVVAKGERLIAQRIKEIAREHGVPVIEDKPLARSLFKICNVGDFVPEKLYRAVAEILAHVYRLKGKVFG
ncbi:MAG: flagellar biosynthesis protein FlhB [candidate division Zixibacteria bacterium]|nr:flagellar biosynthesis protein FlhB [candidate division Zixibacteria bacterium]